MSWEITAVNLLRQDIYRVIAIEKDALDKVTGESVSIEHNVNTGYAALQEKLLEMIAAKKQDVTNKESVLETYKTNISLVEAVDIKGVE